MFGGRGQRVRWQRSACSVAEASAPVAEVSVFGGRGQCVRWQRSARLVEEVTVDSNKSGRLVGGRGVSVTLRSQQSAQFGGKRGAADAAEVTAHQQRPP